MSNRNKTIIDCEKGTYDLYKKISQTRLFKNLEYAQIFSLAAAIGFKDKNYKELSSVHSGGLFRVSYVEKYTDMLRFIQSLAISHNKSLEIISQEKTVYEIAECYANGGIKKLYSMVFNKGEADIDKELEAQINNLMK